MTSCNPIKLAYSFVEPEGGASDKPPIIFCHGLTVSKEHWEAYDIPKTIAEATKRKVYAIDARNHGDSEWTDAFNFDLNVVDLLYFMDNVGAKTATIVGHSMGGMTAMRAALKAPERIISFVAEDIGCSKLPQQVYDMMHLFFTIRTSALEQVPPGTDEEEAKKIINEFTLKNLPPEISAGIKKESINEAPMQFRRLEDGRLTFKSNMKLLGSALKNVGSMAPDYKGLYDGPACFIYGAKSFFNVKGDEENIKKFFPKAELVPIENASHNVHGECRDEFVQALLKFLCK